MIYAVRPVYGRTSGRRAEATVPGSKSMTVRALVMSALADGVSRIRGANLLCGDALCAAECLGRLGAGIAISGDEAKVTGCAGRFPVREARLDVGASGLAARMLTAVLAFTDGKYRIDCAPSAARRPMRGLLEALESLGASFEFHGEEYAFPLTVRGGAGLSGDVCLGEGESSQYLTALLAAAPLSGGRVRVRSSGGVHGYAGMTVRAMGSFGVGVFERDGWLCADGAYSAADMTVEPDASSACYFYAANRILGTDITVRGAHGLSQPDAAFEGFVGSFSGGDADMSAMADQALTLAAVAPFLERPTRIRGVSHIRREECDRLRAAAVNLKALGADCEETDDGIVVYPSELRGGEVDSFSDHRVAMSFALCGLRTEGVVIRGAEACSKSFPGFFDELERVCARLTK